MNREKIAHIKDWVKRHERHVSSMLLISGFVIDNLTLRRIDLLFENLILLFYLVVSSASIVVYNLHKGRAISGRFLEKYDFLLPLVIQFTFGGLFSGFIVFYSRSAALFTSWPFLFILAAILIAGELLRDFYKRLDYQLTVLSVSIFSFLIFYVPILTGTMSEKMFLVSGVSSLFVFYIIYRILFSSVPHIFSEYNQWKNIWIKVLGLFLLINSLYFTNILPPIPLSLKDGGVYHLVTRTTEGYTLIGEPKGFLDRFRFRDTIHVAPGTPVYAFSSVFAPTDLQVPIVHVWQQYNEGTKKWITVSTIDFPITGGSDGGYRGYSYKKNVSPGKWRVSVNTPRGQIIGRIQFEIKNGSPESTKHIFYR